MPAVDPRLIQKHPEFFFPDGNVVLITVAGDPALAFRLHRSVVHRWSHDFCGMIDALDAESDPWTFLGCGVLLFDDDPVDFERLIRVLYDGALALDCSSANFPVLASILSLSYKYDIPRLQSESLSRLFAAYPLTLPEWDAREAYVFSPEACHNRLKTLHKRRPHPLAVVHLALQLDAPHLLIPAYLDLARFPVSEIIRGHTVNTTAFHLPVLQTAAVLRGKETLQRFIADFIKASVENRPQSPLCIYGHLHIPPDDPMVASFSYPCAVVFARVSREMLVMTVGVAEGMDSDPLFVLKYALEMLKKGKCDSHSNSKAPVDSETGTNANSIQTDRKTGDELQGACTACIESFQNAVDIARQHIWNCLPKWFDLRKIIENGFEAEWK